MTRLERVTRAYLRQLIVELGEDRIARWLREESAAAVDQAGPDRDHARDAEPEVLEVSDVDRAAARAAARRLGLHVRSRQ